MTFFNYRLDIRFFFLKLFVYIFQSYTATVLHAAKSLGRGLRELGETVASSLTGNPNFKPGTSPNSPQAGGQLDVPQKGIVTILDIEVMINSKYYIIE